VHPSLRRAVVAAALALTVVVAGTVSPVGAVPQANRKANPKVVVQAAKKLIAADSFSYTATISAGGQTITPDAAVAFDPPRVKMSVDGASLGALGGGSFDAVLVDDVMYLDMRALLGSSGPAWVKVDFRALGDGQSLVGGFDDADPTAGFLSLLGASTITKGPKETVNGRSATRYDVEIDPVVAAQKAPAALRDALTALAQGGTTTAQVWIDGKGRLVRMSQHIVNGPAAGGAVADVTFDVDEYGVTVDAVAPPADQVVDFTQLFGGLVGSLGRTGA
jgi:hypothetical protein